MCNFSDKCFALRIDLEDRLNAFSMSFVICPFMPDKFLENKNRQFEDLLQKEENKINSLGVLMPSDHSKSNLALPNQEHNSGTEQFPNLNELFQTTNSQLRVEKRYKQLIDMVNAGDMITRFNDNTPSRRF